MLRLTELKLPLDHDNTALRAAVLQKLGIADHELKSLSTYRRGHDARKRGNIQLVYTVDIATDRDEALREKFARDPHVCLTPDMDYLLPAAAPSGFGASKGERPLVIGFGPCGLFVALILAEAGYKPIVLERGKAVRERTQDTWGLWRERELNPASNVQFGEGGAGTFSDGKLYSQVKDPRFLGRKVLKEFVEAGAPEEILYVSKPHIGTFRLVSMIQQMRAKIIALGGEIRFSQQVTDLLLENDEVRGVQLADGTQITSPCVALAIGHSARDTFRLLQQRGVYIEPKPFSIGFRVEHPQSDIDSARFGAQAGHPMLGAADYKLVHHAKNGRDVYSFCMCPGGTVVAATSEPGHVVTNGMSQYSRNERNANAAVVVGITPADFPSDDPLAGIALQEALEARAYEIGGNNYDAPAQLVGDFLANRASMQLGEVEPSYKPGVHLTNLDPLLPAWANEAIREAMPAFARQLRGYDRPDAIFTAVETRTSSPIRIKRDRETYQSLNTRGLFPAGEGAGYAGGILSAAIDGIEVAEAMVRAINAAPTQGSA